MDIRKLIANKDYEALENALKDDPRLANKGLPYDETNTALAHPLHRICDGVSNGAYTDEEAAQMAGIFLKHGADVNGGPLVAKKDSPLIAAASLHAEETGLLYIEHGADIYHAGCHGGTALHWAAWCAHPRLVAELLNKGAEVNKLCIDFASTPVFWTIHGYWSCGKHKPEAYLACARHLLEYGADISIPNIEGYSLFDMLDEGDTAFNNLFSKPNN